MRGQVPGTTCNGARATRAINNYQAAGYVRAEREWRARGTGVEPLSGPPPSGIPDATGWRHTRALNTLSCCLLQ